MKFSKRIVLSEWNDESREKTIKFWESRGIIFASTLDEELNGKRGSIFGNLFSYNMSRLMTEIEITKLSKNEIICELKINTIMQHITSWNKEYWELELESFNSVINNTGDMEEQWDELKSRTKKNNIKWTMKIFIVGFIIYMLFEAII